MVRSDGRNDDVLRDIRITRGYQTWPAGSVLIEFGNTRVLVVLLAVGTTVQTVRTGHSGSGAVWRGTGS